MKDLKEMLTLPIAIIIGLCVQVAMMYSEIRTENTVLEQQVSMINDDVKELKSDIKELKRIVLNK